MDKYNKVKTLFGSFWEAKEQIRDLHLEVENILGEIYEELRRTEETND